MPAITEILSPIYEIGTRIYTQAQLVKVNKAECKTLASRIDIVVKAIRKLETLKDAAHYYPALLQLQKCLNECLAFVSKFTKEKRYIKKFFKAGLDKERFEELNKQLQTCIQLFNLGLDAQQITNREQDLKDQKADYDYIVTRLKIVLKAHQAGEQKLEEVKKQQIEHETILVRQLASMRRQISELSPKGVTDSEACYQEGRSLELHGKLEDAYICYQQAAKQGHVKANTNVGFFLLKGCGKTPIDKKKAHDHFFIAACQDHVRAMDNLATMLLEGDGVPRSRANALYWLNKAASLRDKRAAEKIKKLSEDVPTVARQARHP